MGPVCQIVRCSHWTTRLAVPVRRAEGYGVPTQARSDRDELLFETLDLAGLALLLDGPDDAADPGDRESAAEHADLDALEPEGLGDGLGVRQDDESTSRDAEDAGGKVLDQPGRDRGGDHAAGQQGEG